MRSILSRLSLLGVMLVLPGCASLAQDPAPQSRTVAYYSAEELDNLVAPIALYPDALLAQILVAATFPDQVAVAAEHVRQRGTRDIDDQGWDLSVKSVAHYPPVLNMLYNQEDWATALGQAYAAQSGDVMDAVQRLREMAREQGNLVTTPEHKVEYDRERIIIVPANPEVIYVPTYDPFVVYSRPVWGLRFHGGHFSFGLGFPIGSWLVYDVDWWGRRVYYDGWYGGSGWRYYARRHIHLSPVYVHPRYRVININVNIFSRHVNWGRLDNRHRYVRHAVRFDRPDRPRYVDRGRDRDDRRGPIEAVRDRYDRDRNGRPDDRRGDRDGNDRIGNRTAEFDDFRPDRGGNDNDAREREPVRSGFGVIEKERENRPQVRGQSNNDGREQGGDFRNARPDPTVFSSTPRSASVKGKGNDNGSPPSTESRAETRQAPTVFRSQPRASEPKPKASNRGSSAELRTTRPSTTFQTQPRTTQPKQGGAQSSRPMGTFQSQPRVERKSSGGQVVRPSSARSAPSRPSGSFSGSTAPKVKSSGGSPRVSGGGGKARAGGGGKASAGGQSSGGGGKGRKQ